MRYNSSGLYVLYGTGSSGHIMAFYLILNMQYDKIIYQGIRVEVIGQIELFNDRSNTHDFLFTVKHLTGPDTLLTSRNVFERFIYSITSVMRINYKTRKEIMNLNF